MRNKPALGVAVTFLWKVANSGYHWRDLPEGRSLCAVDACQPDWNNMFDRYRRNTQPIQEVTGLFLEFADLVPTETAVVEFANIYGMLGSEDNISAPTDFGVVSLHGEPLELWKQEIEALRNAVDLWRAMLKGKEELVSALAKQLGDPNKLPMKVSHLLRLDDQDPAMAALSAIQRHASHVMRSQVDVDFLFAGNEPRLQLHL